MGRDGVDSVLQREKDSAVHKAELTHTESGPVSWYSSLTFQGKPEELGFHGIVWGQRPGTGKPNLISQLGRISSILFLK